MRDWSIKTGVVRDAYCLVRETLRAPLTGSLSLVGYSSPYAGAYRSFNIGSCTKL